VNVRYTRRALAQIDRALTYLEQRSPQGAAHVRDRIAALVELLQDHPMQDAKHRERTFAAFSLIPTLT